MTQENKQLLLKDLCTRLPYGIKIRVNNEKNRVYTINCYDESDYYDDGYKFDAHCGGMMKYGLKTNNFKPYLRPLSSMTVEEFKEYHSMLIDIDKSGLMIEKLITRVVDWLDYKMFDHRGLISKGLALEAPEGMYK